MGIFIQGNKIILPECHMLAARRRGSCLYKHCFMAMSLNSQRYFKHTANYKESEQFCFEYIQWRIGSHCFCCVVQAIWIFHQTECLGIRSIGLQGLPCYWRVVRSSPGYWLSLILSFCSWTRMQMLYDSNTGKLWYVWRSYKYWNAYNSLFLKSVTR